MAGSAVGGVVWCSVELRAGAGACVLIGREHVGMGLQRAGESSAWGMHLCASILSACE
jgi:hypothetical protein